MTNRESGLSRNERHLALSTVSKIFSRSRGRASSRKSSKPNRCGLAAAMNGAKAGGRDASDALQELHVLERIRELVVADEAAVGLAARRAELVFVDGLEHGRLIELDRLGHVLPQFPLAEIEDADLQVDARLGVEDQVPQAAPGAFELGELRLVHDRRELLGDLRVDRLDRLVDRDCEVAIELDRAVERLLGQRAQQRMRALGLGLLRRRDDAVEQARRVRRRDCGFRGSDFRSRHVRLSPLALPGPLRAVSARAGPAGSSRGSPRGYRNDQPSRGGRAACCASRACWRARAPG